jgi:hypothetical protein
LKIVLLPDANTAIDTVCRSDWGRIIVTLMRIFGDFDVVEEAERTSSP